MTVQVVAGSLNVRIHTDLYRAVVGIKTALKGAQQNKTYSQSEMSLVADITYHCLRLIIVQSSSALNCWTELQASTLRP